MTSPTNRDIVEIHFTCPECNKTQKFIAYEGNISLKNCPLCGYKNILISRLETVKPKRNIINRIQDYFKFNKFCKLGNLP